MKADQVNLIKFKNEYFKKFQELFVKEYGFYFGENRMEFFRNTLMNFISKSPYDSWNDFYNYLANTAPGKILFAQMMDEITIGETYFFRNEPQLETFKEHILPELVKTKRSDGVLRIKIWGAGSSTGEEAYSLAIMLLENLPVPKSWDIQILGTDINRRFLKLAQEGIYSGQRPKRHVDEVLLQKYFDTVNDKFKVKDELKNIVRFTYHNLVKDPYDMPEMIDADIIFCRNVTIYFNNETTKGIMNRFYDCLRNGGYLFLGHSETLWNISNKFKILDFPKGFIYKKDPLDRGSKIETGATHAFIPDINLSTIIKLPQEKILDTHKTPIPLEIKSAWIPPQTPEGPYPTDSLENLLKIDAKYNEGVNHFENKKFDEALKCFDEIIRLDNNYLLAHYAKATIFSNQGKYEQAMHELDFLINSDNLFLDAYYLKSVLHIKLHDNLRAIQTLQKVIYIDPDHALSYFHLANLYKDTEKLGNSKLAWTNLKRVCRTHGKTDLVPLSDNLTYETLEAIAEKALAELK